MDKTIDEILVLKPEARPRIYAYSLASTFRKRAASGLQSGHGFVLPDAKEQVHEKTDLELVTWLVIKSS